MDPTLPLLKNVYMKKLIFTLLLSTIITNLLAQFQLDLGAALAIGSKNIDVRYVSKNSQNVSDTSYYKYLLSGGGFGIYAYPKYHVSEIAGHSISVGVPIIFGLSGESNSRTGGSSSFIYDLNVAIDINGGRLNKRNYSEDKLIGYFAGIGLGIINSGEAFVSSESVDKSTISKSKKLVTSNVDDIFNSRTAGLMLHAGLTVPFMFNRENEKNMGIRVFYKPGFGTKSLSWFGATAYVSFGHGTEKQKSKSKNKR